MSKFYGFNTLGTMTRGYRTALLLNMPKIEAIEKLKGLSSNNTSADTIYGLVLAATEDKEYAEEIYTQVVESKRKNSAPRIDDICENSL